jgi:hypothetical protein
MEEENNLTYGDITASGTITTTTPFDYLTYTVGVDLVTQYRDNVDGKIVIPYAFERVLKKSIEGLEDVRVLNYENQTMFKLNLELKISWDVKQLYTKNDYTNKINILFKTMYPSAQYRFEVKHVIGGEKDIRKEFFEFFSR